MARGFRSIIGQRFASAVNNAAEYALPCPEYTCYVVGDIHGRLDLLEKMLGLIDAHVGGAQVDNPQLIFVGDYIDYGPNSAQVLTRLQDLTENFPNNVTCLMGSHERMLLDFLADPPLRGARWLRAGGGATIESYGITTRGLRGGVQGNATPKTLTDAAQALKAALGDDVVHWMSHLPLSWSSGNLWAVHAGADPQRGMQDQSNRVLLWGHPEFEITPRTDGVWVAHGHVARKRPTAAKGRITLDTGACTTGRLTACVVHPDGHYDFLQT